MNPRLEMLQPYPFERMRGLMAGVTPNPDLGHISLSLGEPKHPAPEFVLRTLADRDFLARQLGNYPATRGSDELRAAVAAWVTKRFGPALDADTEALPVNGTREALFALAQALLSGRDDALVLMPNPFYQIYEGAALLGGAQPYYVNNQPDASYQQDFSSIPAAVWNRTELVYICSPGNPTGQVMPQAQMIELIHLAHEYDFMIASDECYSEIYFDDATPPGSILDASNACGNPSFARCVAFHSLSKRSNLPGLRSGFVAGDAQLLARFLSYRTYHGCAMSAHHQAVSALAWQDEEHVLANRQLYRDKFTAVSQLLAPHFPLIQPEGGFYHWLATPMDERVFAQRLLAERAITVMPGSFLARETAAGNPGRGHVRVAWVAEPEECIAAAQRLVEFAQSG
ncbi:MAG: succinyldiaminopimelate transaminase [Pseudomonadota bacterium]